MDDELAVDHDRLAVVEPAPELVGPPLLDEHLALVGVDVVVVPAPRPAADRVLLGRGALAGAGVHEDAGRAVEMLGVRDGDEVRRQDGRGVVRGFPGDGEAVGGRRLELRLPQSGEVDNVRARAQREREEEERQDFFHGRVSGDWANCGMTANGSKGRGSVSERNQFYTKRTESSSRARMRARTGFPHDGVGRRRKAARAFPMAATFSATFANEPEPPPANVLAERSWTVARAEGARRTSGGGR